MGKKYISNRTFWWIFAVGLALVLGLGVAVISIPYGTETVARTASRKTEKRIALMDKYIAKVLETEDYDEETQPLRGIPQDIVIYKYVCDTLQAWYNQFTEINDDISSKIIFSRVTNAPNRLYSPLNKAGENVTYVNMGPKWYLIKSVRGDRQTLVIAGLEIRNTLVEKHLAAKNGINPALGIRGRYSVVPLSEESGTVVNVGGRPVFKITGDIAGNMEETINFSLFSPLVYADGPVFTSLGVLLLLNTLLTLILLSVYLLRQKSVRWLRSSKHPRRNILLYGAGILLLSAVAMAYIHITLKSVIFNSSLFRWDGTTLWYSLLTFFSYILLVIFTLFQFYSLKVVVAEFIGKKIKTRSVVWALSFALICATYMTIVSGVYGFKKEERRIWGWADRLSIERDLGLEMQLLGVEDAIASDPVIASLITKQDCERLVTNRITETWLSRPSQSRDISVAVIRDEDYMGRRIFEDIIASGTQIYDNSHFFWCENMTGNDGYSGVFLYERADGKRDRLILNISDNHDTDLYGYRSILPRDVAVLSSNSIPAYYSYAKYIHLRLKSSRGNYPYPTVTEHVADLMDSKEGHTFFHYKSYCHFCSKVGNDEIVVISRPERRLASYFTSFSFTFLLTFTLIYLLRKDRSSRRKEKNLLRTKINLLVITSLTLTLAAISLISVIFVYERNQMSLTRLMSGKITTVQALLERRCQFAQSYDDLRNPAFYASLSEFGQITQSDITLYTPSGKVFSSTAPDLFDGMVVGSRINQDAFYNIIKLNQSYYIHKEEIAGKSFYALYAPVFNNRGKMVAIAGCPYTNNDYNFKSEALLHASLIVCLFFTLLLISIWISSVVTDNLFRHLSKLGQKMDAVDIHNLEEIKYKGNDEVSALVVAYNRMVRALDESSRQLAEAERNSAWKEMARQVAHEIKNSLTPVKLKMQRLVRWKETGNENWEEKFDQTAKAILEQVDVLADTANDFYAIARIGDPVTEIVELNEIISEQVALFDNRDDVTLTYIGVADAKVNAQRTHIIRVLVNLLTNSIQAIETRQAAQSEEGQTPEKGQILICLRDSSDEKFYDIVVDDNGTGVSEENLKKLFTPNFTTKSSGTGLGLVISRSIIEACGGTISYKRSFALGGACFTLHLPKYKE